MLIKSDFKRIMDMINEFRRDNSSGAKLEIIGEGYGLEIWAQKTFMMSGKPDDPAVLPWGWNSYDDTIQQWFDENTKECPIITKPKCECGTSITMGKEDHPDFHNPDYCPISPKYVAKL